MKDIYVCLGYTERNNIPCFSWSDSPKLHVHQIDAPYYINDRMEDLEQTDKYIENVVRDTKKYIDTIKDIDKDTIIYIEVRYNIFFNVYPFLLDFLLRIPEVTTVYSMATLPDVHIRINNPDYIGRFDFVNTYDPNDKYERLSNVIYTGLHASYKEKRMLIDANRKKGGIKNG